MKLTVSMATFDDYDGVFFTIQSLRMHHHWTDLEILVLDNNPGSPHGAALRGLERNVPELRVIPVTDRKSSFVKYDAFSHATGDVVLGVDCHVLLVPGFVDRLMSHWQENPQSKNMVTGPLVYDDLKTRSTHMDPVWRGHDFGIWATDRESLAKGDPFEVSMQGMGCFSMLRSTWKGIAPGFKGFGAEEWYIAEKVRSWGGRVVCHPELGWMHRFDWPKRTFPLSIDDKIINYYRGWLDVYGSLDNPMILDMTEYWKTQVPERKLETLIQQAHTPLPRP